MILLVTILKVTCAMSLFVGDDVARGEPALRTGGSKRIFRRTYGTMPASATSLDATRSRRSMPLDTTETETETVDDATMTSPSAAVAPPEFARLTHLSDGSLFSDKAAGMSTAEDTRSNNMMEEIVEEQQDDHSNGKGSEIDEPKQSSDNNPWM